MRLPNLLSIWSWIRKRKSSSREYGDLQHLLRTRIAHLEEAALQGEVIASSALEELQKVATLTELRAKASPSLHERRWVVVLVFAITTIGVALTTIVRVRETPAFITIKASHIELVLADSIIVIPQQALKYAMVRQYVRDSTGLPLISRNDVCAGECPLSRAITSERLFARERIMYMAWETPEVWMEQRTSPPGTTLTIAVDDSGVYSLRLIEDSRSGFVFSGGRMRERPGMAVPIAAFPRLSPRWSLEFQPIDSILTYEDIPIGELSFPKPQQPFQPAMRLDTGFSFAPRQPQRRPVSSVLSGTVRFPAIRNRTDTLATGDTFEFSGVAPGASLRITPAGAEISIQARASRMRYQGKSQMPTVFDWIKSQEAIALVAGLIILIFTHLYAVLRFWPARK